jgi:hypothetical protein
MSTICFSWGGGGSESGSGGEEGLNFTHWEEVGVQTSKFTRIKNPGLFFVAEVHFAILRSCHRRFRWLNGPLGPSVRMTAFMDK